MRRPDHGCSRQRSKAEAAKAPRLFFFFFLDWQIYICNIFVSLLAFARRLNPASSARFDLSSTFWVYFVVEVFDVPVSFPPDFSLTRQESPHLNIWWWVQKFSNHHFRSSSASADLHWQHFGSQTSAAVVQLNRGHQQILPTSAI